MQYKNLYIIIVHYIYWMTDSNVFKKSLDSHLESLGGYLKSSLAEDRPQKIDRKEWLPLYGIIQIQYDFIKNRPNLVLNSNQLQFWGSAFYHGFSMGLAYEIISKL